MTDTKDKIIVSMHIDNELYKKLKIYCVQQDTTIRKKMIEIISDFIEKNPSS